MSFTAWVGTSCNTSQPMQGAGVYLTGNVFLSSRGISLRSEVAQQTNLCPMFHAPCPAPHASCPVCAPCPMYHILIEFCARVPIPSWPTCSPCHVALGDDYEWLLRFGFFFCWKRPFLQVGKSPLLGVSPDRLFTVVKRNSIKGKELKQPQSEGPIIYLLSPMNAGCKSFCVKMTPFFNF